MPPVTGGIGPNGSIYAWPSNPETGSIEELRLLHGSMTLLDKTVLDDAGLSEATAGDYLELLKPRVMSLVVFTAFVGMVAAPVTLNPFIAIIAIASIAIGAGASGALNMWYDADIDAVMTRTASRPVPSGRILPEQALAFGLVLSALSVHDARRVGQLGGRQPARLHHLLLCRRLHDVAEALDAAEHRHRRRCRLLSAVIGWAAATGAVSLESVILFLIIFLWTPPHFWALALFKSDDYARAGIPMMPNVAGEASTRRQIFAYALLVAAGWRPALVPRLLVGGLRHRCGSARRRLRLVRLGGPHDA